MSYCDIHHSYNCDEPHGPLSYERCDWCGEEGVYSDGLCKHCFFTESSRYEESGPEMCQRCRREPIYSEGKCWPCWHYSH